MSDKEDKSPQSITTAIRLLRRKERNLGRSEGRERVIIDAAILFEMYTSLESKMNTFLTDVTKLVSNATTGQFIEMTDWGAAEVKDLREQLLDLKNVGRDVENELNTLTLLASKLEAITRQAHENLQQSRAVTNFEELSKSLTLEKNVLAQFSDWNKEFSNLQEAVNKRVQDLFVDVGLLMRNMNADQLRQAFFD